MACWSLVCLLSVAAVAAAERDLRLTDAVKRGDRERVRTLLQDPGVDVNLADADGTTALLRAAGGDDLELVAILLRAGADANAANVYGVTSLHLACVRGNGLMVERLLQSRANPNAAQVTGETPLMTCARTGNLEAVKSLLARGADVGARDIERSQTALMWAAAQKHASIVRVLIEHGADVRARSERLSLYSPRVPEPLQVSPTGAPVRQGYSENVYFPKFKGGFTPLMFAAQAGDVDSARILLDAGADVDEGTAEAGTALVLASSNGHERAARFLLERSADPNATDCYGISALHWALQEGIVAISGGGRSPTDRFWMHPNMPELARVLLAQGANPNVRITKDFIPFHVPRFGRAATPQIGQAGATPFLLAAAAADINAMRLLVEKGADPTVATLEGITPLMVAAGMGTVGLGAELKDAGDRHLEAVNLAWQLGGDVNAVGAGGRVALHGAALYGLTEVIRFLAEKGANLNAVDMWGQTALSIALADPDGFIWRHLPDDDNDFTFRRRLKEDRKTVEVLLKLGAAPYVSQGRDFSKF